MTQSSRANCKQHIPKSWDDEIWYDETQANAANAELAENADGAEEPKKSKSRQRKKENAEDLEVTDDAGTARRRKRDKGDKGAKARGSLSDADSPKEGLAEAASPSHGDQSAKDAEATEEADCQRCRPKQLSFGASYSIFYVNILCEHIWTYLNIFQHFQDVLSLSWKDHTHRDWQSERLVDNAQSVEQMGLKHASTRKKTWKS